MAQRYFVSNAPPIPATNDIIVQPINPQGMFCYNAPPIHPIDCIIDDTDNGDYAYGMAEYTTDDEFEDDLVCIQACIGYIPGSMKFARAMIRSRLGKIDTVSSFLGDVLIADDEFDLDCWAVEACIGIIPGSGEFLAQMIAERSS